MPPAKYVSPLRAAQAAQTRHRILDASIAAFSESGYAGTSLAAIARRAGVSVETVKQHGPKAALLLAAFGQAFTGEDYDTPLHQRPELEFIRALPDAEFVPGWLAYVAEANARIARLWPRVLEASLIDDEVAGRVAATQRNRGLDMDSVVALLRDRGLCRSTRDDAGLAAVISFVISPEGYTRLVLECGWGEDAYLAWMIEAIERLVLDA